VHTHGFTDVFLYNYLLSYLPTSYCQRAVYTSGTQLIPNFDAADTSQVQECTGPIEVPSGEHQIK